MEFYSAGQNIIDKQETKKGRFTNYYFVFKTEYVKEGKVKESDEWRLVDKEIYDAFSVGDKVQLTLNDFFNKGKKYSFISECNPSK